MASAAEPVARVGARASANPLELLHAYRPGPAAMNAARDHAPGWAGHERGRGGVAPGKGAHARAVDGEELGGRG